MISEINVKMSSRHRPPRHRLKLGVKEVVDACVEPHQVLFEGKIAAEQQATLFVAWQKVVVVGAGVAHAVVAKLPTHKMLLVLLLVSM
jgi:hypothetical protein